MDSEHTPAPLTEVEIEVVVGLLAKLSPGFLPYPIFEQIGRLTALAILEVVPVRMSVDGKVEVLLIDRGPEDPLFANQLHTPGTVLRATDVAASDNRLNQSAYNRIQIEELKGLPLGIPMYVDTVFHTSRRGAEHADVYWVEVQAKPPIGEFYMVDELPERIVSSQIEFIKLAAEHYKEWNKNITS